MQLQTLLDRLEGVRKQGQCFTALCPSHKDTNNSLSFRIGSDGRILIHCFAGCEPEEIVAAMGLRMSDLFPSKRGGR
jgi:putative DNA primase/helicase